MRMLLIVFVAAASALSCSGRTASCTCGADGQGPNGGTEWACNFSYGEPTSGECKEHCLVRPALFGGDDPDNLCANDSGSGGCCRVCESGCACGDACISCSAECHTSGGCACDG